MDVLTIIQGWFYGLWYPPLRPLGHTRRILVMSEWKNHLTARHEPFWRHWQSYAASALLLAALAGTGAAAQGELWTSAAWPWLWRGLLGATAFACYNAAMRIMYQPHMKALESYLHITGEIKRR